MYQLSLSLLQLSSGKTPRPFFITKAEAFVVHSFVINNMQWWIKVEFEEYVGFCSADHI